MKKYKLWVVMDRYSIQNCRLDRIYGDSVDCGFTSGLTLFESAGWNHDHLTSLSPLDFKKWTSFWFILLKKMTKDQNWKLKTIACSSPIRITYLNNFYELYLANIWRHVWSLNCGTVWPWDIHFGTRKKKYICSSKFLQLELINRVRARSSTNSAV